MTARLFPACQVRVVPFCAPSRLRLVRHLRLVRLLLESSASSSPQSAGWQGSPPEDLNHKLGAFPARLQLRGPLGSVPRRTSTASSGGKPPAPSALGAAGPQPTHNDKHNRKHTNTNTQPQTHPQHTTRGPTRKIENRKTHDSRLTTIATCSSPWDEDK